MSYIIRPIKKQVWHYHFPQMFSCGLLCRCEPAGGWGAGVWLYRSREEGGLCQPDFLTQNSSHCSVNTTTATQLREVRCNDDLTLSVNYEFPHHLILVFGSIGYREYWVTKCPWILSLGGLAKSNLKCVWPILQRSMPKDLGCGILLASVQVRVTISQKVSFLIQSDSTVWKKLPSVNKNHLTLLVLKTWQPTNILLVSMCWTEHILFWRIKYHCMDIS